ncbi:ankyrin repeat domain-containing protein [Paenibacillus humicola]|uniref:ankyrin repeat domain-containing protein n=1 Tax=Paenibacillus humicola TaxID=3110540 RepID=UPI00237BF626|nr:ankyrin repeat domain-containing protein [Paenibacillus humicola]
MPESDKRYYRTGEFAAMAGVTKRSLQYYDRLGLLKPGRRSDSGQRLYAEEDLVRLQQIVTLKFIGFSLGQIRNIFEARDIDLAALLAMQREWVEAKLRHLRAAAKAIRDAQRFIERGDGYKASTFQKIIEVIEMQANRNWLDEFIDAATSGREPAARAILAANPGLPGESIHAAAIVGDVEAIRAMLKRDAALATKPGGSEQGEPILLLCFSCFLHASETGGDRFTEAARLLLEHGADPNAFIPQKDDPYERNLSALYGAVGIAGHAGVAEVLLAAGANPNDGESIYHATEFPGFVCLDLLFKYGGDLNATPALFHKLDLDDEAGVRWFMEHGADPLQLLGPLRNTPLHWAVYRGRSAAILKLLLEHGAPIDARRADGKTAYRLAVRFGHTDAAELLLEHGADAGLEPSDRFFGACALADEAGARAVLAEDASLAAALSGEAQEMLIEFVDLGKTDSVRLLLDLGFGRHSTNIRETGNALHHAAWFGRPDLVRLLIERGFSLTDKNEYGGTPLGSAIHGSIHYRQAGGNHAAVALALLQAGAEVPPKADGSREVYEVLRRHGASE